MISLLAVVQVPLNGDDEYDGRLMFYHTTAAAIITSVDDDGCGAASAPQWVVPRRPAGSCTVHDRYTCTLCTESRITELLSGVRYGLYVLI